MPDDDIEQRLTLVDGSRLIVEACAQAGADAYVGYPITPASLIYTYASQRFPTLLSAPDEITAVQWMAGLSATGRLPVTATSFPGFALMVEGLNMAYMMELPMVIVLVQRMGPSTGTATAGAQGDLFLLHGLISGGYPLPVFCIAGTRDCWTLPPVALRTAVELRTPVVLLTSKEMVMTERSFDLAALAPITPIQRPRAAATGAYRPYAATESLAPPFRPLGDDEHQVRMTASTHDAQGLLRHSTAEALANTRRLPRKVTQGTPVHYYLDEQPSAEALILTYGITAGAAREAVRRLRRRGSPTSLLVAQTLLPLPGIYAEISARYRRVVVAEENLPGQLAQLLFGRKPPPQVRMTPTIGHLVTPERIVEEVLADA
jgi:2-oxoglutarate ferredoxin oxidoreductase subunit alpha